MKSANILLAVCLSAGGFLAFPAEAAEYRAGKVGADLSRIKDPHAPYWKGVEEIEIKLLAQMMVKPMPDSLRTAVVKAQILHDGKHVAFRLRWADKEASEAGKLGEQGDAVAVQLPALDHAKPPPIFMGASGNPVHILHWRAQYQRDELKGMKSVKDIYPNLNADIYPNEFPDRGRLKPATEAQTDMFVAGKAAGNPQSSRKRAVDEMLAEGFGTSVVTPGGNSSGRGKWKDGEWTVVISRAMACPGVAALEPGKGSSFGVAVWQGGAGEVGARKSMTMAWTPFILADQTLADH
jgi:hypothetical protein